MNSLIYLIPWKKAKRNLAKSKLTAHLVKDDSKPPPGNLSPRVHQPLWPDHPFIISPNKLDPLTLASVFHHPAPPFFQIDHRIDPIGQSIYFPSIVSVDDDGWFGEHMYVRRMNSALIRAPAASIEGTHTRSINFPDFPAAAWRVVHCFSTGQFHRFSNFQSTPSWTRGLD